MLPTSHTGSGKMRSRIVVIAIGLQALSACRDVVTTAPESARPAAALAASLAFASANESDLVARAVAGALAQEGVRNRLFQAFRASPWVEHKLVLQEFAESPGG